ncbi:MAG TPA: hypothetical protein VNT54_07320 [Solirubrobacteraceae bacterium]|nr:hypothetical protein [Solirubrobacteraceae bacterium]
MDEGQMVRALREAGHEREADALRDVRLARELREAGHEGLAAELEAKAEPGEAKAEPGAVDPMVEAETSALREAFVEAGIWERDGAA